MTPFDTGTPASPGSATDSIDWPAGGPGWYESSRELRSGLDVAVGLPADAPLDDWIATCLRQRNVRPSTDSRRLTAITASPSSITAIA